MTIAKIHFKIMNKVINSTVVCMVMLRCKELKVNIDNYVRKKSGKA